MYTTSIDGDPSKLVLFEIFSSEAIHKSHMAQEYTHQLAVDLGGKLVKAMKVTRLNAF